jgi:cation:H+ antiporter
MIYLGLLAGFVILLVSGDLLVRGSVALAVKFQVPALVIGLTVVAFGTSAPELVVSVRAGITGAPGIAVGNIVGSNIANVLLVLGLPALIKPTECNQPFIGRNTFYVVGASGLFVLLCFLGPLTVWHGALLFALIILFLVESGRRSARSNRTQAQIDADASEIEGVEGLPHTPMMIGVFIAAGLIGLPFGASIVVDNATKLAMTFGVSEEVIGLTIIALGTSLPELATTLTAALRGHCAIAIGNVLGSNLFNILAIMGLTALVAAPIPVPESMLRYDLWIMLAVILALVPFVIRRATIRRAPAMGFVVAYCAYVFFSLMPDSEAVGLVVP